MLAMCLGRLGQLTKSGHSTSLRRLFARNRINECYGDFANYPLHKRATAGVRDMHFYTAEIKYLLFILMQWNARPNGQNVGLGPRFVLVVKPTVQLGRK
jgi:hypothetical protein